MTCTVIVPRDGWLVYLAQGWRFVGDVPWPMPNHHGRWSVFLWREA